MNRLLTEIIGFAQPSKQFGVNLLRSRELQVEVPAVPGNLFSLGNAPMSQGLPGLDGKAEVTAFEDAHPRKPSREPSVPRSSSLLRVKVRAMRAREQIPVELARVRPGETQSILLRHPPPPECFGGILDGAYTLPCRKYAFIDRSPPLIRRPQSPANRKSTNPSICRANSMP
jgi:hypothetical protein